MIFFSNFSDAIVQEKEKAKNDETQKDATVEKQLVRTVSMFYKHIYFFSLFCFVLNKPNFFFIF